MLLDKLIIKGNEIKEPGLFGKTVYIIKGREIKEPGFFGKTVFVIDGDKIKEPGLLGRALYVIKNNEIRTPGLFGQTVAKTRADGTVKYNKPNDIHIGPGQNSTISHSTTGHRVGTSHSPYVEEETLDELQQRLDLQQGCIVDFTNCNPEIKTYRVPSKYQKLQAIAPALNLDTIRIHAGVALIVAQNVKVNKEFIVEEDNKYYSTENGILYNKEKTILVKVPIEYDIASLTIPSTVSIIGEYAFGGCTMGSFIVPSSVTKIGKMAFAYCKRFKSIFIPETVNIIEEKAFEYDNTVQISSNAASQPNSWKLEGLSTNKPIKWGVN